MDGMKVWWPFAGLLIAAAGCGRSADQSTDVGYDDGYAAGYNTTCEIRTTMIEGAWDDEAYAAAYRSGYADGEAACRAERAGEDDDESEDQT